MGVRDNIDEDSAKIITTQPLRAKEAQGFIANKYPVVDHQYDALGMKHFVNQMSIALIWP